MFAPEELASLREVAIASLPGTCSLARKQRVRLPNGSWRDDTVTVAIGVPCRKVPSGQTPQEQAVMQGTLGQRGIATFVISGAIEVFVDDVIVFESKSYGVVGSHERTNGEYTRVIVYDDNKAPVPSPP